MPYDSRLASFISRIENLQDQRKSINDDIKDVIAEAKSTGYDAKALRAVVSRRTKDPVELEEFETLVHTYEHGISGGRGHNSAGARYDDDI